MDSKQVCKFSDMPTYCCECLLDNHFVVAGGGGPSKTGMGNKVRIMELDRCMKTRKVLANIIAEMETGNYAVMKMSVALKNKDEDSFMLAIALEKHCEIYKVTKKKPGSNDNENNNREGLKQRKRSSSKQKSESKSTNDQQVNNFTFKLINKFQSVDEKDTDSKIEVTSVAISNDGSHLASGLSNGQIKLWDTRNMKQILNVEAHKEDVKDISISPDNSQVVTLSADGSACLWSLDGTKVMDLHLMWNMNVETRDFKFRNCKFSIAPPSRQRTQDVKPTFNLYTTHQAKKGQNMSSFLTKWVRVENSSRLKMQIMEKLDDRVSSLAVSGDGHYVGVGYQSGFVDFITGFRLNHLRRIRSHQMFVTEVSFLNNQSKPVISTTGNVDARLLSVSCNGSCHVAILKPKPLFTFGFFLIILMLLAILAGVLYHLEIVKF